jgi:uncharacterized membrane protein YtjA (UPF0391 family)
MVFALTPNQRLELGVDCSHSDLDLKGHALEVNHMLRMAVLFLIFAVVAALFGFGLVADFSFAAAKILFFVFIVLAVLSFLGGSLRAPPP